MLTIEQAAQRLGVSPDTVRRLIREGALGANKIRGQLRISEKDLEDYLASTRVTK